MFPWHNLLTSNPPLRLWAFYLLWNNIYFQKPWLFQNIKSTWRHIPRRCFWNTSSTSLTFAKTSDGDGCSKSVITDSKRMMMTLGWLSTTAKREGQDARGFRIYFNSICPEKLYGHSSKITRINFYINVKKKDLWV